MSSGAPHNHTETSKQAARMIVGHTELPAAKIVAAVSSAWPHGMTRHEIAAATHIDLQTVCARCNGLVKSGELEVSDQIRRRNNRPCQVLVARIPANLGAEPRNAQQFADAGFQKGTP